MPTVHGVVGVAVRAALPEHVRAGVGAGAGGGRGGGAHGGGGGRRVQLLRARRNALLLPVLPRHLQGLPGAVTAPPAPLPQTVPRVLTPPGGRRGRGGGAVRRRRREPLLAPQQQRQRPGRSRAECAPAVASVSELRLPPTYQEDLVSTCIYSLSVHTLAL